MIRRSLAVAISIAFGILCGPLPGQAQPGGKVYRIGFLSYFGCGTSVAPNGAFRQGLRELGYVEDRNLALVCRDAPGMVDRLPDAAVELTRLKIDVLVAEATPSALAAKRATNTIPIVMLSVGDPIRSELVASLARPGGNVTGVTLLPALEVVAKVFELLKEVAPHASRTAVLWDPTNPGQAFITDEVDAAGRRIGIQPQRLGVQGAGDLPNAFAAARSQRSQAIFVYPLPLSPPDIGRIAQFALSNRLPAVTPWEGYAEQGFLLFYGTRLSEQYRRATVYVDKILKGAKPSDLPIEQAVKFDLVVNLKTARAIGLRIPQSVILRADQVLD